MTGKVDVIMATTETFVPGWLYDMPLADLQQDRNQPRKYIDPAALDRLRQSRGCTQDDLARIMGKTKASISQTLSLTRLPLAVRDECRKDPSVPTS